MNSRDRRALVLGGLAVGCAVLTLRVLPWSVRSAARADALLHERATLLARTREEMASLPKLRDSANVLSQALIALPYYKETNPLFAKNALYVAGEILGQANVRS